MMIPWNRSLAFLSDQIAKTRRNPARVPIIMANYGSLMFRRTFGKLSRRLPAPKSWPRVKKREMALSAPADIAIPTATSLAAAPAIPKPNPFISEGLSPEVAELSERYKARKITNFLIGQKNIDRQNAVIARSVCSFFDKADSLKGATFDHIFSQIGEFQGIYLNAPVTLNNYGVHFSTGLFLFLIARRQNPALIVESGVYKGLSTYLLSAACPQAALNAFDPNLSELVFRCANAKYHAMDWMDFNIRSSPLQSSLAFFDDHQCQARRVVEAYDRGFRHLVFDNSWPIEAVIGCGWPPIPSVDMVMNDLLAANETVQWIEDGRIWTYQHDQEMQSLCAKARSLISAAYDVPSLYRESGFGPTSAMKYVELVP